MSALPTVVLWSIAAASVIVLAAAGYVLAVTRLKARLEANRRQAVDLQGRVSQVGEDPFGEMKVLAEQLLRIRQRLERLGARTGQEADAELADGKTIPPPEPAVPFAPERPAPTAELEADLDLARREVLTKNRRIEELEAEKRWLDERATEAEAEVRRLGALVVASPPAPPKRPGFIPVNTVEGPATGDGLASLIDTLQQEADSLRAELTERDERIRILEKGDSTGIVHELERIRRELQTRTEELSAAKDRLALAEKAASQAKSKAASATEEKETMATRALEVSAELRGAQEKVRDLERQLASRGSGSGPAALEAGVAPAGWPAQPLTTTPGRPLASGASPLAPPAGSTPPPPPPGAARPTPLASPKLIPPGARVTPPAQPGLTPPTGSHPSIKHTLFGAPAMGPPPGPVPRRADPFDVNTLPSAPPDMFDVHNKPTATHSALPHPHRPTLGADRAVPPHGSAAPTTPAAKSIAAQGEGAQGERQASEPPSGPSSSTETGRFARPRRPTGSIFPVPSSREGPDSK